MKYEVKVKRVEIYFVEVEANCEKEAIDLADSIVQDNPEAFHHDSDVEFEIADI